MGLATLSITLLLVHLVGQNPSPREMDGPRSEATLFVDSLVGEEFGASNCDRPHPGPSCEDALFRVCSRSVAFDETRNKQARERYEREWEEWKHLDRPPKEPRIPIPSFARSLEAHRRYLKTLAKGDRRDQILFKSGLLLDRQGRSTEAFFLFAELEREHPDSRAIVATRLRLGEFHFVNRNYDSAIAYFRKTKSVQTPSGSEPLAEIGLYHEAEAYSLSHRYAEAIETFFEYIELADRKRLPRGDLRVEAILSLGSCLAESPVSLEHAKEFFLRKGRRTYEDTVFYELAYKHYDRDQLDIAVPAMEYALQCFPRYHKAADLRQKLDKAKARRDRVKHDGM
ncbi:MAG: hypothetical protein AAB214_01645 [Fibrobacterota bacterium]